MKKARWVITSILAVIVFAGASSCDKWSKQPVYVTIYSHNEDSWGSIVGTPAKYASYRSNLLERLGIIKQFGAKLNWQSDITVLQAMIDNEKGSLLDSTGGKNILRYMLEELGFSVDPHGHLIQCNYADLAYLIEQLGVTPSGIIGGLKAFECGAAYLGFLDYIDWQKEIDLGEDGYISGRIYPEARWKPEILSVPAFGGHWYDEFSSGIWRPGVDETFYEDQKKGSIVYVGQGYPHDRVNLGATQASGALVYAEKGAYIKELVRKIKDGELPPGAMCTASIHVRDTDVVTDSADNINVNEGLTAILQELKPLADSGDIVYVTYQEAVKIWKLKYGARAYQLNLSAFSMYDDIKTQAENYCSR